MKRRDFCIGALASLASLCFASADGATQKQTLRAKPFVKWVGGKGQLLEQLTALLPRDFAQREDLTYVEPFVGGGAMLFHILSTFPNIRKAVINDLNGDLITVFRVIKEQPEALITALKALQDAFYACGTESERKAFYLAQRVRYNAKDLEAIDTAACFIFLNRTCFNGLYRVNAKGKFNVPFGKAKKPKICDEVTIRADSLLLQKVEILNGDFAAVLPHVKGKAFFYFDPPYRPLTETASFTAYSKDGFGDDQQKRLADFCRHLDGLGHQWLLSNSDPHNVNPNDHFFETIYDGFEIHRVFASRMINSKADGRGKITELAIRNYTE